MSLTVLFVCEGNLCRSPIAEQLFNSRVPADAATRARSAGLGALVGQPMEAFCQQALSELGTSPAQHRAARLSVDMAREAALVLTAEAGQRERILRTLPSAHRRTFALKEFLRLGRTLTGPPPEPMPQRVARVAAVRGTIEPPQLGADDIRDPYRQPIEAARQCATEVSAAIDELLDLLGLFEAQRL